MNSTTLVPFSSYGNGGTPPAELESGISSLFKEMDQLFNSPIPGFFNGSPNRFSWNFSGSYLPKVDTLEAEEDIRVTAELPGMEEKDIDVSLVDGALTLKGEKNSCDEEKTMRHYRMERSYGMFERTIPLPMEVEADKVEALFKNGVLTVTLPKTKNAKEGMKKIPISTS